MIHNMYRLSEGSKGGRRGHGQLRISEGAWTCHRSGLQPHISNPCSKWYRKSHFFRSCQKNAKSSLTYSHTKIFSPHNLCNLICVTHYRLCRARITGADRYCCGNDMYRLSEGERSDPYVPTVGGVQRGAGQKWAIKNLRRRVDMPSLRSLTVAPVPP